MNLHPISITNLQVLETGQFIIRYTTDFSSLNLDPATDPVFLALHNSLLAQSPTYNLALSQIHAKAESEKLLELDIKRDKKISTLRRNWSVYEYSDDADEQEAYRGIKIVLNSYKKLEDRNFEAETLGIDNLVAELRSTDNLPFAETLGMVPHINNLETANTDFKTTFNTRSSEGISTVVYNTKALKKEILNTYRDLAEYVLVMAKRKNTPYYISILSAINSGREYYSNILARRKPSTSSGNASTSSGTVVTPQPSAN